MAKTNNIVVPEIVTTTGIQSRIYEIRGERVMLDCDLAKLYGVATKVLNQAVKRNIERFPNNFMFQLSNQEVVNMRSQIVTASGAIVSETPTFGKRNVSARPYAFTKQGVAMLSAILKSPTAIQVSIAIMEAFVQIRKMIVDNREHALELGEVRTRLQLLEERLENSTPSVLRQPWNEKVKSSQFACKIKINTTFFEKYLHIQNKFCTFAAKKEFNRALVAKKKEFNRALVAKNLEKERKYNYGNNDSC